MRNLNFKYAGAWNFLPFGPEGIELNFSNYGNIVLIHGENRDAKSLEKNDSVSDYLSKISSNGSGKSSLQEIIVWTLYGKTIKRPEKIKINQVIHNKIKKDCRTIVDFDKYRVMRCRSFKGKDSLKVWESEEGIWDDSTEITQGTSAQTEKKIKEIVGLSYEAFVNVCIFTDDQRSCFLECDKDTKLEIVENLMQLGVYREWYENARSLKKEIKSSIDFKVKEYDLLLRNKQDSFNRLELTKNKQENWKVKKQQEIDSLERNIKDKETKLASTDNGKELVLYQQAQEKIKEINLKVPELEEARAKINANFALLKEKDNSLKNEHQKLFESFNKENRELQYAKQDISKNEKAIKELNLNIPGTKCGYCKGIVDSENINSCVKEHTDAIDKIKEKLVVFEQKVKDLNLKIEEVKSSQSKLKSIESQAEQKRKTIDDSLSKLRMELSAASQVREPKADSSEYLISQQIEELKNQILEKQNELEGKTPFFEILENDQKEVEKSIALAEEKEKEVKDLEAKIPYYDYWINGFGPTGIRKWVIDGIIPDLNNRINYWLQFLIDNTVTLNFDNEFQEKIERNPPDGDPYIYYAMSTGQRRRLNLSVGHSFAYITELSAEALPSLIFLDEVTTNVDPLGVQGIYNMICELATDKQVFITTHDPDLVRMLQGVSVINLIHENGFTKKV